jgi:hypothetical protein
MASILTPERAKQFIDIETTYVVLVRHGNSWVRPDSPDHHEFPGLDAWHAVRRAIDRCVAVTVDAEGVAHLATAPPARLIPDDLFDEAFRTAHGRSRRNDDGAHDQESGPCAECHDARGIES